MKKVFPKIIARLQITFTGLCMSRLYILILRFDHRNIAKIFYTSLNKKAGSKGRGLEIPFIRTYLFCKLVKIFEIARNRLFSIICESNLWFLRTCIIRGSTLTSDSFAARTFSGRKLVFWLKLRELFVPRSFMYWCIAKIYIFQKKSQCFCGSCKKSKTVMMYYKVCVISQQLLYNAVINFKKLCESYI